MSNRVENRPLVFVDVETTGISAARGRVIELAAIRVERGQITGQLATLLDPGQPIPHNITRLTGIADSDVAGQPGFRDVADQLLELLDGAILVAHNVRFDYGFLKQEFSRLDRRFRPDMLCTVRLSRALYPNQPRHRLADVITRHNIQVSARHRAYDDAMAIVEFWRIMLGDHGVASVESAALKQLRRPSLPRHIDQTVIDQLPQSPGVYIFGGEDEHPIYIGKSVRMRDRVLSHFSSDVRDSKEFKIAQMVRSIKVHPTSGELSALLLESWLIKQHMPLYNRRLRRVRKLSVIIRSRDEAGYDRLAVDTVSVDLLPEISSIVGVYGRRSAARQALEGAVDIYQLCPKLCGLENASTTCFRYQLGKCRGACGGYEPASSYNRRLSIAFEGRSIEPWPYDGAVYMYEQGFGRQTALLVDRWMVREFRQYDGESENEIDYRAEFDYDTYQILRSYMLRFPDRISVRPLE